MDKVNKEEAIAKGFAGYNNCPHICVDVPDGFTTITAKTSDGRRITFAFCPYEEGKSPQCVDVKFHDGKEIAPGIVQQNVSVRGQGSLLYSTYGHKEPATLIVVKMHRP